jgi:hypothetical protein
MAAASFHKFTLLPPELQRQIWMSAAESTRGAHFFTYNDKDEESEFSHRNRFLRRTTPYGPYLALAVPVDDRSITRTARKKHEDDFVLGTFLDNGVTRSVTVRSETDLIIVCPTELGELDWDRVHFDCPPSVSHLALEYNPSWPQFGQGPPRSKRDKTTCERLAWLASERAWRGGRVWFIDYSIRRRSDADGDLEAWRKVFWCATGRFVQVWHDDDDWDTGPETACISLREDRQARLRLEVDLEEMGIDLPVRIPPEEPEDPDRTPEWDDPPHGPYFGVLAFEPW